MRYLNTFPRSLLELSFSIRLLICMVTTVLSVYSFLNLRAFFTSPIVFVIPISLAAWMFRRSGLFVCLFCILIALWTHFIQHNNNPLLFILNSNFLISALSFLFIGLFVTSRRRSLDIIADAQQQLAIAYEQQHELNQIKDQFLQNVNHELRTPLTAIYGYLELLLEHNDRINSDMRVTFLENAMQSCDELQLLVNNVLDTMGVVGEKQHIVVEELAVVDTVYEVLERFDPKTLQAHDINIAVPDYIIVLANEQYLRQVLRNLLSNAFKYAPIGTAITISAALYGSVVDPFHPSPEIRISVKDEGPGIPADEIPLLFGQFVRLRRDTSGRIRGSGLGLYLSKQFVELMHGKIWVESEGIPGKGSAFHFTLPCVPHSKVKPKTQNRTSYQALVSVDTQTS